METFKQIFVLIVKNVREQEGIFKIPKCISTFGIWNS
jgi:hypothetical protein